MSTRLVANGVEWESEGGTRYISSVEVVFDLSEQPSTEVQVVAEVKSISLYGAVLVEEDVAVDRSLLEALAVTNRREILKALEPLLDTTRGSANDDRQT